MTDRSQYCAACEIEIGGPCRACLGLSERENTREWARLRVQPRALPDDIVRLLDHSDAMDEQIAALTAEVSRLNDALGAGWDQLQEALAQVDEARLESAALTAERDEWREFAVECEQERDNHYEQRCKAEAELDRINRKY